jgi:hypothetical protein
MVLLFAVPVFCSFRVRIDNTSNPSYTPVFQPDLDTMGVCRGAGQDLPDPAPGQFSAVLVCFLDDIHTKADPDGIPLFSAFLVAHARLRFLVTDLKTE